MGLKRDLGRPFLGSESNLEADGGSDGSHVQAIRLNNAIDDLGEGGPYRTPVYSPATNLLYVTDTGPGVTGINAGLVALSVQSDCSLKVAWSDIVGSAISNSPNSTPTLANGVCMSGSTTAASPRSTPRLERRCGTAAPTALRSTRRRSSPTGS